MARTPQNYADAVLVPSAGVSMMENLGMAQMHSQRVDAFRDVIKKYLKEGIDFMVIGNNKHLKRAAVDKIAVLAGVADTFDIETTNHPDGSVEYLVKCRLLYAGEVVCEGIGICSSREKAYKKQEVDDIKNTLVKMARIRAKSDAVKQIAALSEIFDADEDDVEAQEAAIRQVNSTKPCLKSQRSMIDSLFTEIGTEEDKRPAAIKAAFNKEDVEYLTRAEAEKFIEIMQAEVDKRANESIENLAEAEDIPF